MGRLHAASGRHASYVALGGHAPSDISADCLLVLCLQLLFTLYKYYTCVLSVVHNYYNNHVNYMYFLFVYVVGVACDKNVLNTGYLQSSSDCNCTAVLRYCAIPDNYS